MWVLLFHLKMTFKLNGHFHLWIQVTECGDGGASGGRQRRVCEEDLKGPTVLIPFHNSGFICAFVNYRDKSERKFS